jgi:hypothetical protein
MFHGVFCIISGIKVPEKVAGQNSLLVGHADTGNDGV